jgi:hypothetical protein
MITEHDAFNADEFHSSDNGTCKVWQRQGRPNSMPGGGFLLFIATDDGDWWHITGANTCLYHTAADCPRRRGNGGVQTTPTVPFPGLEPVYDEDGYDADGYDRDGYDRSGYDRSGYDADDCDRHGNPRLADADDLNLAELWAGFRSGRWSYARKDEFREHLRSLVTDPDEIDSLEFCGHCEDPAWDEDLTSAMNGNIRICDSCWSGWDECHSCEERYPDDDLYSTLNDTSVCLSCRSSYYSYCDDCDGYYHDSDADEHEHSSGNGCCESPQPEFKIRNDGCEPLAHDTRATITLPAGVIDNEGLKAIREYLRSHLDYPARDVIYDLESLDAQWQTRRGNYTRRLSSLAHRNHGAKLSQEILSQVGVIAREHSNAVSVEIEITRDLNMSASDFYHDDSCWWGSYYESRCALKTNGGFGLRSFNNWGNVTGRAWVMPLRQDERGRLTPTFETETPAAFVVFNGYGDLGGYAPARIMAHMAGWTYRKIGFDCSPMYINAGGYLVAPEEIAEQYTDGHLSLSVDQHSRLYHTETAKELSYV